MIQNNSQCVPVPLLFGGRFCHDATIIRMLTAKYWY
jgi:hypothetical protein